MKPTPEVRAYFSSISGGKSKSKKKLLSSLENLKKAWRVNKSKNKEKKNERKGNKHQCSKDGGECTA
jgi:hypothetical protein